MLFIVTASAAVHASINPASNNTPVDGEDDEFRPHRGWMIKAGYANQMDMNWIEAGFGRINFFGSQSGRSGKKYLSAAAAAFTLGGEFCISNAKPVYGPKLAIEANLVLFGARAGYAYYIGDDTECGVTTLECGLCILSRVYLYGGYNFLKDNSGSVLFSDGWRISAGLNFPFGIKQVEIRTKLPLN